MAADRIWKVDPNHSINENWCVDGPSWRNGESISYVWVDKKTKNIQHGYGPLINVTWEELAPSIAKYELQKI